jgi:hypothetical protein
MRRYSEAFKADVIRQAPDGRWTHGENRICVAHITENAACV